MRAHTLKVRGRRASIDDRTLVQGTVGEDVLALDLDEEWDGLVVTVAFKWQHDSSIVAKQVEGGYEVPWECNQQPGKVLIAVEGTKDGKVMRHATIDQPMVVLPSEEASGTSPTDPTVSEYRKVYEDVKLATATANGAADDAKDAAEDALVAAGNADAQAAAAQLASQVAANAAADVKRRADSGEFKGEKGDPGPKLTFADLTEADKAELQKPATDAAATANAAAKAANDAADAANTAATQAVSDSQAAIAEVKATEAKLYPAAENILVGSETGTVAHVEDAFAGASLRKITVEGACKQDGTPSPDNPVPIEVVEHPVVKVTGRNLLGNKYPAYVAAYNDGFAIISKYSYADPSVVLPFTTGPRSSDGFGFVEKLKPNVAYTLKAFNAPGKSIVCIAGYKRVEDINDASNAVWHLKETSLGNPVQFSVKEGGECVVFTFAAEWGDGTNEITYPADFKVTVEFGSTATEYAPYTSQSQSFTLPTEHPYLAKLPDGTADEIVVDRDGNVELVARVNRVLLDTSENWNYQPTGGGNAIYMIKPDAAPKTAVLAPRGIPKFGYGEGQTFVTKDSVIYLIDSKLTNVADIISWFGAGMYVYYELITPVTYSLGTVTLPSLLDSISNVWTDAEITPRTGIEYTRDVNIVIANIESAIASITEG